MFEAIQDDEFCIYQSLGYLSVQAGIATTVEFARQHEAGHFNLPQPWRHFGLSVDAEDVEKYLRICLDDLALARSDPRRLLLHKFVREPSVGQGVEGLGYAVSLHGRHHALHLGAIVLGAERSRRQQSQRDDALRVGARVGGSDHAAQRVADHMRALHAEPSPQRFKVGDKFFESERTVRFRRCAVPTQIVADALKIALEVLDQSRPPLSPCADPMHQKHWWTVAFDRIDAIDRLGWCRLRGKTAGNPPILLVDVMED